jgi:hypothetical protein
MFRKTKQAPRCGGGIRAKVVGICMMVLVALTLAALIGDGGKETGILNTTPATTISEINSNTQSSSTPATTISESNSNTQTTVTKKSSKPVSIFYVGNSIIQVNNTPRFMHYLRNSAQESNSALNWSAFLRGGQTLKTLVKQGMKFGHIPNLDYVIMNDQTQGPARTLNRGIVVQSMIEDYFPMFQSSGAIPVFIVTAAYREKVKGSAELGSVENFTKLLVEGYEAYAAELEQRLPVAQKPILAPVGLAYLQVYKERPEMWKKLFAWDSYHPAAQGTFLQCCVLYRVIFGELPPKNVAVQGTDKEVETLWMRLMVPQDRTYSPPTKAEAEYLWDVAGRVVDSLERRSEATSFVI